MGDVIEPAATGRAKCRRCQEKIDKGVLRFGERVPNAFGDGEATYWFHLACAAEQRPEKLGAALALFEGELPDRAALDQVIAEGVENPALVMVKRAERAPTGRARCQECHEKIDKDELRVALERESEVPSMATTSYVHAALRRCPRRRDRPRVEAPPGDAGARRRGAGRARARHREVNSATSARCGSSAGSAAPSWRSR